MRFRKIKWNGKKVVLEWDVINDDVIEHRLTSPDPPRKRFTDALDSLIPDVLGLIEAPDHWADGMRVTGVSINYEGEDDRRGLVVTCLRELEGTNAPLVINTPHLKEQVEDIEEGSFITDTMLKALTRIHTAVQKYLDGDRMQTELPLDETG